VGTELETAQIVDVVPTLLALMELPLPAEVDGQVRVASGRELCYDVEWYRSCLR